MKGFRLVISAVSLLTLSACESSLDTPTQDNISETGFIAQYDPVAGILPFPTNLLFSGTTDGTLNIQAAAGDGAGTTAVKTALNDLDGFSTVAPIIMSFTDALDSSTLVGGSTVRVFEVNLSGLGGAVTSVVAELTVNTDYAVFTSPLDSADGTEKGANKLVISPLKALKPDTSYMVVVTKGVKNSAGKAAAADITYAFTKSASPLHTGGVSNFSALTDTDAQSLEGLRQINYISETTIDAAYGDLVASDIVVSWSFTTQSISDVLTDIRAAVAAGAAPASVLVDSTADSPLGAASIYAGTLTTNYYLNTAANVNDLAPLSGSWRATVAPGVTAALTKYTALTNTLPDSVPVTIPLMATIPNAGCPASVCPVVIFQHGITRNRTDILAVTDALAGQGFAVVAIDMPLHGLTGNETDGTEAFYNGSIERTFDLDLINNSSFAAAPDGETDPSGQHYINLNSLLTSRDNVRQSVSDLYVLRKALEGMNAGGNTFDISNIYFVGHSLGGMAGAVFLATEPTVKSAVIAMAGGGIAKLLDGSASFGPVIAAGLNAAGVPKGSIDYESFMGSAQTVIDSADPINYAAAAVSGRGLLFFEVIGNGTTNLPDQTIPNNVVGISGTVDAPLSGTDPLITAMGLTQQSTGTSGTNLALSVKYTAGHHGSILTPDDAAGDADTTSLEVFTEMQSEMVWFINSDGASITINNANIDIP